MFGWKFITSDWGFLPPNVITFRWLCIYGNYPDFLKDRRQGPSVHIRAANLVTSPRREWVWEEVGPQDTWPDSLDSLPEMGTIAFSVPGSELDLCQGQGKRTGSSYLGPGSGQCPRKMTVDKLGTLPRNRSGAMSQAVQTATHPSSGWRCEDIHSTHRSVSKDPHNASIKPKITKCLHHARNTYSNARETKWMDKNNEMLELAKLLLDRIKHSFQ